jgi:hypothetical protein
MAPYPSGLNSLLLQCTFDAFPRNGGRGGDGRGEDGRRQSERRMRVWPLETPQGVTTSVGYPRG